MNRKRLFTAEEVADNAERFMFGDGDDFLFNVADSIASINSSNTTPVAEAISDESPDEFESPIPSFTPSADFTSLETPNFNVIDSTNTTACAEGISEESADKSETPILDNSDHDLQTPARVLAAPGTPDFNSTPLADTQTQTTSRELALPTPTFSNASIDSLGATPGGDVTLDVTSDSNKENEVPRREVVPSKRSFSNVEEEESRTPLATLAKRSRKSNPSAWARNVNKEKKMRGEEYETQQKDKQDGKWKFVSRPEKKMGQKCQKTSCAKRSKCCAKFTDDDCVKIFSEFWACGDTQKQNTFIQSLVDNQKKSRVTVTPSKASKRLNSKRFRLKKDGGSLEVCKEMFVGVLGITNWRVNAAVEKSDVGISKEVKKPRNPHPSRGFAWTTGDQDFLANFFRQIPKAPSHYCRKDSKKIYLDVYISSMDKLYKAYVKHCEDNNRQAFSSWKVSEFFNDNNYSLFQRKKDKCNTCVGHEVGNVPQQVYDEHMRKKNEGFDLKEADKKNANNKDTFVATADTEALLIAPLNDANCMFFRTKLNLHNFTFFNLHDKRVMNYLWTEGKSMFS